MSKSGEFYTFDEVIKHLNIDEQRLKRLVAEGEIRAFREGDEMKFKKNDIDTLDLGSSEEGETREIDLSAGSGEATETLTDDLIFDEGDELDLQDEDDIGDRPEDGGFGTSIESAAAAAAVQAERTHPHNPGDRGALCDDCSKIPCTCQKVGERVKIIGFSDLKYFFRSLREKILGQRRPYTVGLEIESQGEQVWVVITSVSLVKVPEEDSPEVKWEFLAESEDGQTSYKGMITLGSKATQKGGLLETLVS